MTEPLPRSADRQAAALLRDVLRANLFDGDEGGTVTMPIARLLDEIVEIVAEHRALQPDSLDVERLREVLDEADTAINELHGELGPDHDAPWHKHEATWRKVAAALREGREP